jgi:hypothetical protein
MWVYFLPYCGPVLIPDRHSRFASSCASDLRPNLYFNQLFLFPLNATSHEDKGKEKCTLLAPV